ncbi:MAG: glycosyltransferase family 2 protein [Candidatus Omnitrophica bacterium]|nr:glycosyltransferase family 2 protein [Candidatus Omnitrophota bacterium]
MPKFSFIIPTYNAERYLDVCLKSIREQSFPQNEVEILIADGASTDKTLEVAKKYGARILYNEKRLAEYGVGLGMREARGELAVVFAADNELVGKDWLSGVQSVFENNSDISALWGKLASGPNDPALNKYFELIQSDPLNWFLNNNLQIYKKNALFIEPSCFKFKVDSRRPLVWGANGLVCRTQKIRPSWTKEAYMGDNDAFQSMVERGDDVAAYCDRPFVYHHHVARISDWVKKWRRNFLHHFADKQESRNMNWVIIAGFKRKLIMWIFYNFLFFISVGHSIYLALREKNRYWLYHPLVSFLQCWTYILLVLGTEKGRNFLLGRSNGQL